MSPTIYSNTLVVKLHFYHIYADSPIATISGGRFLPEVGSYEPYHGSFNPGGFQSGGQETLEWYVVSDGS